MERCEKLERQLALPGEGGERQFRQWLASDLLRDTLGWPAAQIKVGEIFDVLLLDDQHHPLITITEAFLREIPIPFPRGRQETEEMLALGEKLPAGDGDGANAEARLGAMVGKRLGER